MFSVGDSVVYPYHGAGTVEDIQEKEILGQTLNYFVVFFPLNNVTLMLPENRVDESGLRNVIEKADLNALSEVLCTDEVPPPIEKPQPYSKENELLLKTGSIYDAASVIARLTAKQAERSNGLHVEDRKNLDRAKQFVLSELKAMNDLSEHEAVQFLEKNLQHA